MAAMDEGIGNVTAALDRLGFSDNLITLFISDNGGPIKKGEHEMKYCRGDRIVLCLILSTINDTMSSKTTLKSNTENKKTKNFSSRLVHSEYTGGLLMHKDWARG